MEKLPTCLLEYFLYFLPVRFFLKLRLVSKTLYRKTLKKFYEFGYHEIIANKLAPAPEVLKYVKKLSYKTVNLLSLTPHLPFDKIQYPVRVIKYLIDNSKNETGLEPNPWILSNFIRLCELYDFSDILIYAMPSATFDMIQALIHIYEIDIGKVLLYAAKYKNIKVFNTYYHNVVLTKQTLYYYFKHKLYGAEMPNFDNDSKYILKAFLFNNDLDNIQFMNPEIFAKFKDCVLYAKSVEMFRYLHKFVSQFYKHCKQIEISMQNYKMAEYFLPYIANPADAFYYASCSGNVNILKLVENYYKKHEIDDIPQHKLTYYYNNIMHTCDIDCIEYLLETTNNDKSYYFMSAVIETDCEYLFEYFIPSDDKLLIKELYNLAIRLNRFNIVKFIRKNHDIVTDLMEFKIILNKIYTADLEYFCKLPEFPEQDLMEYIIFKCPLKVLHFMVKKKIIRNRVLFRDICVKLNIDILVDFINEWIY